MINRDLIENYSFYTINIKYENISALLDHIYSLFDKDAILLDYGHSTDVSPVQEQRQYYFVGNAINFSFWFDKYDEKYQFNNLSGSEAMWDVLQRNQELLDAEYLKNIEQTKFREMFGNMPMEDKRIEQLCEAGKVLTQRYNGKAINILREADYKIENIIREISSNFELWNDSYGGIHFYKRIQAFINCILNDSICRSIVDKTGIEKMTILADYHIPKLFRHYEILEYSEDLKHKVDDGISLNSGSIEETDIRIATILVGIELLEKMNQSSFVITPSTLDGILWREARKIKVPYHLCKSIWY